MQMASETRFFAILAEFFSAASAIKSFYRRQRRETLAEDARKCVIRTNGAAGHAEETLFSLSLALK